MLAFSRAKIKGFEGACKLSGSESIVVTVNKQFEDAFKMGNSNVFYYGRCSVWMGYVIWMMWLLFRFSSLICHVECAMHTIMDGLSYFHSLLLSFLRTNDMEFVNVCIAFIPLTIDTHWMCTESSHLYTDKLHLGNMNYIYNWLTSLCH